MTVPADAVTAAQMERITSMVSVARTLTQDDSDAIITMIGAVVLIARSYGDAGAIQIIEGAIRSFESCRDRLAANVAAATPAPTAEAS